MVPDNGGNVPNPLDIIRSYAPKVGLDPAAVVAYALTQGGTDWGAVGDHGTSFGPFQAHIGGAAGNRSPQEASAWANSQAGLEAMMDSMAKGWSGPRSGPEAAAFIVGPHFGRGADPASDEAKARAAYTQATKYVGGAASADLGSGVTPAAAPPGATLPSAPDSALIPPTSAVPAMPNVPLPVWPTNDSGPDPIAQQILANGVGNPLPLFGAAAQNLAGPPPGPVMPTPPATPASVQPSLPQGSIANMVSGMLANQSAPDTSRFATQLATYSTPKAQASRRTQSAWTGDGMHVEVEGKPTDSTMQAVELAQEYLSTPYSNSQTGFDTSGLLQYVWGKQGVAIPGTTYDQFSSGQAVAKNNLQPGDAVFFTGADPKSGVPGHVGMYVGDGKFIETPHSGATVRVSDLDGRRDFVGARRFGDSTALPVPPDASVSGLQIEDANPGDPVPTKFQTSIGSEHDTAGLAGFPAHDYMAPAGAPVVAPASGTIVRFSGHDPSEGPTSGVHGPFGWSIYLQGDDGRTYYMTHLGSRDVEVGQRVEAGTPIATVGDYAKYGGADHVHMGVSSG
jgi:cell wall-associated NlpC family hydrolase